MTPPVDSLKPLRATSSISPPTAPKTTSVTNVNAHVARIIRSQGVGLLTVA
jgi:hypothetical protein